MDNTLFLNKSRLGVFAALLLSMIGMTGYALLRPAVDKEKDLATLDFPAVVPLTDWRSADSQILKPEAGNQRPGYQYRYQKDGKTLQIQARYYDKIFLGLGHAAMAHKIAPPASINPEMIHDPQRGYYAIFTFDDRAYLTGCLNARGETTVTQSQSVRNRYKNGWSIPSVIGWLALGTNFADSRCLWTVLTLTDGAATLSPQAQASLLQSAWIGWQDWWKPRFEKEFPTVWIQN